MYFNHKGKNMNYNYHLLLGLCISCALLGQALPEKPKAVEQAPVVEAADKATKTVDPVQKPEAQADTFEPELNSLDLSYDDQEELLCQALQEMEAQEKLSTQEDKQPAVPQEVVADQAAEMPVFEDKQEGNAVEKVQIKPEPAQVVETKAIEPQVEAAAKK